MSKVDNRIVELQFNNKQFEDGVKTSLKSLLTLNKSIEATGDTRALAGLQQGIETISSRFTTMGIIGVTTLQEITKSVLRSAKQMTNSLVGLVTEGGKRRALNIEQAKFQFSGLGMDVKQAMEDALYAVKGTAYGLDEAAKAASQLGASGLELGDDMKGALRGISGVAAMTNSSYDDISRIFINVAGNGRLMGQQLLSLSGRGINAAAVLAESMGKSEEAVRKMISAGQIDFETFYKAMDGAFGEHATKANETYTGSLSNVKAALSRLGASMQTEHLNDMRDVFNSLIPVIDNFFDAVEPFIGLFNDFRRGIVDNFINTLSDVDFRAIEPALLAVRNSFVALLKITDPVRQAFKDIFPPSTSDQFYNMVMSINSFTEKLFISDTTSENLRRTFKGLFAVADIGKEAIFALARSFGIVLENVLPIGDGILGITAFVGDYLVAIRDVVKENDIFNNVFRTLKEIIVPIGEVVVDTITAIINAFRRFGKEDTAEVAAYGEAVEKSFKPFTFLANVVTGAVELIKKGVKLVGPMFVNMGTAIGTGLGFLQEKLSGWLQNFDIGQGLNIFNSGMLATFVLGLRKFMDQLLGLSYHSKIAMINIKNIFSGVTGMMVTMQRKLKAQTLITIAAALGILTVSILLLSTIDGDKLGISLLAITTLMVTLFGTLAVFEKVMSGAGFKGIMKISGAMILLSVAVLILASALKKLSSLDWGELAVGLAGTAGMIAMLVIASKALSSTSGKLVKGAIGFIFFATAINILANAVRKLGEMDTGSMIQGLLGVGGLLAGLGIFMKTVDLDGMGLLKGLGILAMAAALNVMATAVKKLGDIDTDEMIQGLLGLGAVLLSVGVFMKMTGDVKKVMSTAIGLTILAGAMILMSVAIAKFGQMETSELTQGLIALAVALGIIAIALNLTKGALGGAMAIIVVAGALAILTPVLKSLGSMSLEEIGKSLLMVAGTFAVLGIASALLAPVIPMILALAGAVTLLGVGMALIGGGLMLFSTGLAALAVSGSAGVAALVLMITALVGLIPMVLVQIGKGIIEFVKVLGDGAATIVESIVKILVAVADAVIEAAPKVAKAVVALVLAILDALVTIAPVVGAALIDIVVGLVTGLVGAVKDLLGIESPSTVFTDIGKNIIDGLILGLKNGLKSILEWGANIGKSLVKGVKEFLGIKSPSTVFSGFGGDVISGFVQGIKDNIKDVKEWAGNIATTVIDGVKNLGTDLWQSGKDAVSGFANGIKDNIDNVATWGKNIGSTVLNSAKGFLGIKSPSRVFMKEIAKPITDGLVKGIKENIPEVKKTSVDLGKSTTDGAAEGIKKGTPKVTKQAKATAKVVAKTVFEETKEWIDRQKKYFELSLEDEFSKWKSIQDKYKAGSDERLEIDKNMSDLRIAIKKREYDKSMFWIEEEKHYTRLSLKEELAAWERVQARYIKGSEERIAIDRKIFTLRNDITKESYQKSLDWIDEEKYYNRLSMEEELAAWERVQNRYKKGTDERKKLDREVYRVRTALRDRQQSADQEYSRDSLAVTEKLAQDTKALEDKYAQESERIQTDKVNKLNQLDNDYYKNSKDINDKLMTDVKALEDRYNDALKSRTSSLYSSYGLFDEVQEPDSPVTGEQLMGNLEDQVQAFEDWQKQLYKLQGRGFGDELIKELEQMGPKSLEQVNALNELTDDELSKYSSLWQKKHEQAKTQATHELKDLRIETQVQIQALRVETESELELLKNSWQRQTSDINYDTRLKLEELRLLHEEELTLLGEESDVKLEELKAIWESKTTELSKQVLEEFEDLEKDVISTTTDMKEGTVEELEDMNIQMVDASNRLSDNMILIHNQITLSIVAIWQNTDWASLGRDMIDGIMKGVSDSSQLLVDQMAHLAETTLKTAKKVLNIKSPSRKFIEIGEFIVEGLVKGIDSETNSVTKSINSLASHLVLDDINLTPTIRPVLDLSDIIKGKRELDGLLDNNKSNILVSSIRERRNRENDTLQSTNTELQFIQNNYSPKALSRVDIYRQTKNQISTIKGVIDTL